MTGSQDHFERLHSPEPSLPIPREAGLRIVVLYNDPKLAHVAVQSCFRLEDQMPNCAFQSVDPLCLDTVQEERHRAPMATKAALAHVVIMCLNPTIPLSVSSRDWLFHWTKFREPGSGTLIGIVPTDLGDHSERLIANQLLEKLAAGGSMTLHSVAWP